MLLAIDILIILISYYLVHSERLNFWIKPSSLFFLIYVVTYLIGVYVLSERLSVTEDTKFLYKYNLICFSYILFFSMGAFFSKVYANVNSKTFRKHFLDKIYIYPKNLTVHHLILIAADKQICRLDI